MTGRMQDGAGASVLRAYIAERDIAWLRFAVIAFNVVLYLFWLPHDPARHTLALVVSVVAMLYAIVVVALRPYEHLPVLRTSAYTVFTDSALITLWLYATGGLESPFYALWMLSLVAVVFRFSPAVVAVATLVYVVADVTMLALAGDVAGNLPAVATRVVYLLLLGALGVLLGHRWSHAVQERVRMTKEVARREEAVREADRLRALSEAALEGIIIHRDGKILEANPAACRLLGLTREQILGQDSRVFAAPESAEAMEREILSPRNGLTEFWIQREDGKRRVAVQGRPLEYLGEPARIVAVRDVTEEYEARRARETAAAQQMEIQRLQDLDRFKTRFINTAAHELNTPLTPIKLQLHLLRDALRENPRALDMLERNLDRLGRLVGDMLDVARLQSGRLPIRARAVDIAPVCDEVYETFSPSAAEAGVHLDRLLPERIIAHADPERVVQIVTNLVSNALKFTPPGGRITVLARETADAARIEVIDTGRGLSADDQQKLFQPFSQAHEDPAIPGSGLGLYICRSLAEAMGGRVGAESPGPGHGARFWVDLPRDAEHPLTAPLPALQEAKRAPAATGDAPAPEPAPAAAGGPA